MKRSHVATKATRCLAPLGRKAPEASGPVEINLASARKQAKSRKA